MQRSLPPAPWQRFLSEIDERLTEPVELHCIGGFVISLLYSMPRPTADVDFLTVVPQTEMRHLLELAGLGSALHKRTGLHLQHVGVASLPEAYEARLIPMFPGAYTNLRLLGAEAYDLALSKLERNLGRDREDIKHLDRAVPLDADALEQRYKQELRPYLMNVEHHDLTLGLWIEMLREQSLR
ncbi:MAG: DUF6036 family nucleotidyltransferase [Bryobacteraceae bacterium]